ncbi:MAG: patatin-like phospholipase family protein [Chloroflexota bacterium]
MAPLVPAPVGGPARQFWQRLTAPAPGKERLGLALGGGGARGLAHIGVLKVFEEAGIGVDLAVGSSIGGVIALAWAAGLTQRQMSELVLSTPVASLLGRDHTGLGLSGTERVGALAESVAGRQNIEDLPRRGAVVVTDLSAGKRVVLASGSIATAVRATIAIPGLFSPVVLGGRVLVDGGILEPIPMEAARQMGATRVVAVNVGPARGRALAAGAPLGLVPRPLASAPLLRRLLARWRLLDVAIKALEVQSLEIAEMRVAAAHPWLVLHPDVGDVRLDEFERAQECIDAGEAAARAALPVLTGGRAG